MQCCHILFETNKLRSERTWTKNSVETVKPVLYTIIELFVAVVVSFIKFYRIFVVYFISKSIHTKWHWSHKRDFMYKYFFYGTITFSAVTSVVDFWHSLTLHNTQYTMHMQFYLWKTEWRVNQQQFRRTKHLGK